LRRSDSIRNSVSARPKIPNYGSAKPGIRLGLPARPRSPGTEFLDAETGRQKPPPKRANASRDENPGSKWPKNPAETPYLASHRKHTVCKGWMVADAVLCEPVSTTNSRLLGNFIGNMGLSAHFWRARDEIPRQPELLMPKFAVQRNRELRRTNREFGTSKRDLLAHILKSIDLSNSPCDGRGKVAFEPYIK
jgi:hypothetical protein